MSGPRWVHAHVLRAAASRVTSRVHHQLPNSGVAQVSTPGARLLPWLISWGLGTETLPWWGRRSKELVAIFNLLQLDIVHLLLGLLLGPEGKGSVGPPVFLYHWHLPYPGRGPD